MILIIVFILESISNYSLIKYYRTTYLNFITLVNVLEIIDYPDFNYRYSITNTLQLKYTEYIHY